MVEPLGWIYLKYRPRLERDRAWLERAREALVHFRLLGTVPFSASAPEVVSDSFPARTSSIGTRSWWKLMRG